MMIMAARDTALQILTLLSILSSTVNSIDFNYPAVFNFGDSNSDTGDLAAGLGFLLAPPNGQIYFKTPTGRFCDGRLIVDFLSKAIESFMFLVFLFHQGTHIITRHSSPLPMASKNCILIFLTLVSIFLPLTQSIHFKFPAVFNFGDSNSDTGNLVAAGIESIRPPYGEIHFQIPSGRYCDGRLIIDFLMDAMELPFLNAYLESVGVPNFRKGCNFAAAGSTILPATATSVCPFSFGIQVNQFLRFKARVLELLAKGQNDLAGAFYSKTFDQIVASIPNILVEFETGIKKLYDQGARNFWIHNTGPLGCLTQNVAKFGTDPSKLDELGCVSGHNQAAKLFNLQLHALTKKLQDQHSDSNITYVDIYTIKSNLIANYSRYGFEQPIMACCGYGGPPLNYDRRIVCGQTKVLDGTSATAQACNDSTEYVNWDGIHYSEAANQYISSQILTGKFSDPPFADKMPFLLNLQF
ncbi:hypothetical protein POTOM_018557 [Populus tomentosa]|uniref:Uncharacterized protein n=1 Tax=Populus tomentosa TaxID=118781 RepID=A0A8X8D434_POPTO|nr:hypothetical protein POTOM_018557 [Populus tomentosa]